MSIEKAHWPNNLIFILAAIGSAAGLGNLWRFPFLAYEFGGGAFVLAIIIANIFIGIPLLMLEISLGQMTQKGAPDAFRTIRPLFRYIGWLALVFGFMVLAYYMSVMAWGIDYLGSAFTLGWGTDTNSFFFNTILNISSSPFEIGGFSTPVVAAFFLAWALVYFSVWKGVKSVSRVVVWTATIPFFILFILIIRAITLPGAGEGIRAFLIPEWSALSNPRLWLAAFSQVFFSLSIAFGIMVGYGSLKQHSTEITKSAIWVAIGNFLVSFMSGIAVFGTLGYMAYTQNLPLNEVVKGGPSLAFVVFPAAINLLPALATIFAILFFAMFLTLAIDSAFSLLEAFAIPFRDHLPGISPKKVALIAAIITGFAGIPFLTHAGLYYLDIVDHYVVNYGLIIVGLLEAVVIGWMWKSDELTRFIREHSSVHLEKLYTISIKYITPLLLTILLILNLREEFKTVYGGYPVKALIYFGVIPLLIAPILAFFADKLAVRWKDRSI